MERQGRDGGLAWLIATPQGRLPAVLGRRQRGAWGWGGAMAPYGAPAPPWAPSGARVRERYRMAETRRGSGSVASRARPRRGHAPPLVVL